MSLITAVRSDAYSGASGRLSSSCQPSASAASSVAKRSGPVRFQVSARDQRRRWAIAACCSCAYSSGVNSARCSVARSSARLAAPLRLASCTWSRTDGAAAAAAPTNASPATSSRVRRRPRTDAGRVRLV
ncbi:Uncharacterised protein [Bordetella pertussis]|nr:Uncharacterised protein [Bordetella pertussis]